MQAKYSEIFVCARCSSSFFLFYFLFSFVHLSLYYYLYTITQTHTHTYKQAHTHTRAHTSTHARTIKKSARTENRKKKNSICVHGLSLSLLSILCFECFVHKALCSRAAIIRILACVHVCTFVSAYDWEPNAVFAR